MKTIIVTLFLIVSTHHKTIAQAEFELRPSQCMLMTGKGPGQDGTINPNYSKNCYAIIENIGDKSFFVRVQKTAKL